MNKISNVKITPLKDHSDFVKPYRMRYVQDNINKTWDLLIQKPSVSVIIYNKSRDKLILVKQFRPSVYATVLNSSLSNDVNSSCADAVKGITLELCAGILDKADKTPKEIAKAEVLEECGFEVPLHHFEHVLTFLSGVGISGANMNLFYTEVTDQMRVSRGGGLECEGELIDVIEMTPREAESYLKRDVVKSPMFTVYGLSWFLNNKRKSTKNSLATVLKVSLIGVISYVIGMIWSSRKR